MKIKDITPHAFTCAGGCCPSIFETDRGTYLIIGSKVHPTAQSLSGRMGSNETVVEVPVGLLPRIRNEEHE